MKISINYDLLIFTLMLYNMDKLQRSRGIALLTDVCKYGEKLKDFFIKRGYEVELHLGTAPSNRDYLDYFFDRYLHAFCTDEFETCVILRDGYNHAHLYTMFCNLYNPGGLKLEQFYDVITDALYTENMLEDI